MCGLGASLAAERPRKTPRRKRGEARRAPSLCAADQRLLLVGLGETRQFGVAAFHSGVERLLGGLLAGPDGFELFVDDVADLDEVAEAQDNDRYFDESNGRFVSFNQSKRLLDRWKKPGDITDIPRHGVYTEFDDRLLEDASFLRLKNLMLSYTFPQEWLRKTRFIGGARIYAQAQNLFTFTKFTGLDPEGNSNMYQAQYPMARQFTFGLDLTF